MNAPADPAAQLVEDATLAFTLGDNADALAKLQEALTLDAQCFDAWHAMAEVHYAAGELDKALEAAKKALECRPEDIHAHTTLSRIHMRRGDRETAEHHGAQARMLSWKAELQGKPADDD